MSSVRLTIDSVLVCDDVRMENNGKAIIIGVYSGTINPLRFPTTLRLVLWMIGRVEGRGEFRLEVRIRFVPDGTETEQKTVTVVVEGEVTEQTQNQDVQLGVTADPPIEFTGPGRLIVAARIGGEEFKDLLTKTVLLAPKTISGAPSPHP
jgi:hypothetical protein